MFPRTPGSTLVASTGLLRSKVAGGPQQMSCAPGRNRTYETRFRKPVLYPLSYEGGACVKRGRKPVAELRSSFGTSILAVGAGCPAGYFGPGAALRASGLLRDLLRPLRAAGEVG